MHFVTATCWLKNDWRNPETTWRYDPCIQRRYDWFTLTWNIPSITSPQQRSWTLHLGFHLSRKVVQTAVRSRIRRVTGYTEPINDPTPVVGSSLRILDSVPSAQPPSTSHGTLQDPQPISEDIFAGSATYLRGYFCEYSLCARRLCVSSNPKWDS